MNSSDRLSDERYRIFIENINDGVYELDIYGNFTYFNESLCRIFGYPREKIQWQNFKEFMDKKHARKAYAAFVKIWVTREGFSDIIWEIIDENGNTKIIELSASLIIDKEGKKLGFRGIARDVTEKFRIQKALEESERRYQLQYKASRKIAKRYKTLLDFVPYPIVTISLEGKTTYLNPAFTETFGWTFRELEGKQIPFVPRELHQEIEKGIKKLMEDRIILRHETKRLTKDGRILDVIMRIAYFAGNEEEPGGYLILLRDFTVEKKLTENNETLLRISTALPAYPDLEDLLDYISSEIKQRLNTDGALVVLLDEEKNELSAKGAAYKDPAFLERIKEICFPPEKGLSGKAFKTGKPVLMSDKSEEPSFYPKIEEMLGFSIKDMVVVPVRGSNRFIGVFIAFNKKEGAFDRTDLELLSLMEGTVSLSIDNARFSEATKEAYREVASLNRAKDKVINHLSHELKTPASILLASLGVLSSKLTELPKDTWMPTMERAKRSLDRLFEIQYQVEDIMEDKQHRGYNLLTVLFDQCKDELEALIAAEVGETHVTGRIRDRIEEIFGPKHSEISEIYLDKFIEERLEILKPQMAFRQVDIVTKIKPAPSIFIPEDVLQKTMDGLIKNAIENTPDEGRIEIFVQKRGEGTEVGVFDRGIGIAEENQPHIFEGFFSTQETLSYSSKRPFDFNAGGKGADLLRMKIFSERYGFKIELLSSRCSFLLDEGNDCPGKISECSHCMEEGDCFNSGGTAFTLFFSPAQE